MSLGGILWVLGLLNLNTPSSAFRQLALLSVTGLGRGRSRFDSATIVLGVDAGIGVLAKRLRVVTSMALSNVLGWLLPF